MSMSPSRAWSPPLPLHSPPPPPPLSGDALALYPHNFSEQTCFPATRPPVFFSVSLSLFSSRHASLPRDGRTRVCFPGRGVFPWRAVSPASEQRGRRRRGPRRPEALCSRLRCGAASLLSGFAGRPSAGCLFRPLGASSEPFGAAWRRRGRGGGGFTRRPLPDRRRGTAAAV